MTTGRLQLGAHTFIWSRTWDEASAHFTAASVAAAGLQVVEIPLLDPAKIPVDVTLEALRRYNLTPTCSLGLPATAHAPDWPEAAGEFLRNAIDVAAALGSQWLTGSLYGHIGHLSGAARTKGEIVTVVTTLQGAADHARDAGIRLGIEVINRYETHLLNTAAQAVELLDRIDRPGVVFGHLDTFHMNVEESDIEEAVRRLGERLGYVHLAESNRGPIGSGLFPFGRLFQALDDVGFSGPAIIEAFINAPPELRRTTASWRPVAGDASSFIDESVRYLGHLLTSEGAGRARADS